MKIKNNKFDVIILGGGVAGCASARQLADDHNVVVLEKGQIAGEASGLAAGNIRPTMVYADTPAIAKYANSYFREFSGTGEYDFTEWPRIEIIAESDVEAAQKHVQVLQDHGFPVEFLDVDAASAQFPLFNFSNFGGVVEYRDTGWLDPYTYTNELKKDAERKGTKFETGVYVNDLLVEDNKVIGVETDHGNIFGDTVVTALGWRSAEFLEPYIHLPVRPFLTQILILEPPTELGENFPIGRVPSSELYFRPEHNGDLLVGAGNRYNVDNPNTASTGTSVDEDFKYHVVEELPHFLPGFDKSRITNGWAGIDGITPDKRAIIDAPAGTPDGLIVATGFSGGGVRDSPITAAIVRSLVTGEPVPFPAEEFSLDRISEYSSSQMEFEEIGSEAFSE